MGRVRGGGRRVRGGGVEGEGGGRRVRGGGGEDEGEVVGGEGRW